MGFVACSIMAAVVNWCISLSKQAMIFNNSPYTWVVIWIPHHNLHNFPLDMAWNISCTNLMNPSCIQERKYSNQMRSHINVSSNQVVQISTKTRNTPILFTHNVMHIMHEIFLTGALSHQQFTSSMVPSLNVVPGKNLKHPEAAPM